MLPDVPGIKNQLRELFTLCILVFERHQAPLLRGMRTHAMHEGRDSTFHRRDGVVIDTSVQAIQVGTSHSTDELKSLVFEDLLYHAFEMGQDLARQKMAMFFDAIREACDRDGTAFDAGGRVFSPDMILDMLENMQIDFDESGNPRLPSLFVSPEMYEKLRPNMEKAVIDPEMEKRHKEIIDQKRGEWLARQADRRLVE